MEGGGGERILGEWRRGCCWEWGRCGAPAWLQAGGGATLAGGRWFVAVAGWGSKPMRETGGCVNCWFDSRPIRRSLGVELLNLDGILYGTVQ